MHRRQLTTYALSFALIAAIAGCGDRNDAVTGARQTGFPGQVSAGGGTSGEVMARSTQESAAGNTTAGTPGIPQGRGGNTGGAATGGTVQQAGPGAEGSPSSQAGQSQPAAK